MYKESSETNQHCLNRLKKKYTQVVVVQNQAEAVEAVLSGKVGTQKNNYKKKKTNLPNKKY